MTTTLIFNNGVEMPALGFGVFQTPPDETASRRRNSPTGRLSTHRHRRRLRQRARCRRRHPAQRRRPRRRVHRDQGVDQRLRLRPDSPRLRQERRQARRRPDRPAHPPPSPPEPVRSHHRCLQGARDPARRRQGPRHRGQQLHARPPRSTHRRDHGDPGRQPDRGPPLLHLAGADQSFASAGPSPACGWSRGPRGFRGESLRISGRRHPAGGRPWPATSAAHRSFGFHCRPTCGPCYRGRPRPAGRVPG